MPMATAPQTHPWATAARFALLAIFVLIAPPGVQAGPSTKATTQPVQDEEPIQPVDPATVVNLLPLEKREGSCVVKIGKKSSREVDYLLEPSEDNTWRSTIEGIRVVYFSKGEKGEILLPREDDLAENVQVSYHPALQILPGTWADGRAVEGASDMEIKNAKSGLVREKGTCTYRVELVGRQKVDTPAGTFDAILVRETRHIRLKLAKSDVTVLNWYVPGKGEVAEHVIESTKALGFLGGKKESDTRISK